MSTNDTADHKGAAQPSCDPTLTRRQFIDKLVKRSLLAGTLTVAPLIADSFIAPKAFAQGSTTPIVDTSPADTGCVADAGTAASDRGPFCVPFV